jgi:hypothetical protein
MQAVIENGLLFGAIFSLIMSVIIIVSLRRNPMILAERGPEDIRQVVGPIDERARTQRRTFGILTLLFLLVILILSIYRLNLIQGGLTFWSVFLNIFIIVMVWNLVDLLVIDWLFLIVIQPKFIIIPGTEGLKGYKDFGFHFRGFLKGIVYSVLIGLLIAGISVLVAWIFK